MKELLLLEENHEDYFSLAPCIDDLCEEEIDYIDS